MSVPQLRPLRVGEVLDAAIKIYRRNFGQLSRAVLVVVVPVQILVALVLASTLSGAVLQDGQLLVQNSDDLSSVRIGSLVVRLLTLLSALLASGACLKAVSDAYLGERPDWRQSLRFAFRRLGSLLWVTFLITLAIILLLVASLLPGVFARSILLMILLALPVLVYFGVSYCLALPSLLVEDRRGTRAIRRSVALVRGRWWATFATLFVAFILVVVIQFVIGLIFRALASALFSGSSTNLTLYIALSAILGVLGNMISTPFLAACVSVIYYDQRVRKEGYDLELLARDIGRDSPTGQAMSAAPAAPATESPAPPYAPGGLPSEREPTGLERPGDSTPPPSRSG